MLLQLISEIEIFQSLDPATSIWESAQIIAFINDWRVKSNGLTGRPKRKKTLLFPKKIDQEEIAGTLGNRGDLFSRQRKRDNLRHLSSTLADLSEVIRSNFGNQSVIAWTPIDAVMIVAVAQL